MRSASCDQPFKTNMPPKGSVNSEQQANTPAYTAIHGQHTRYQSSVKSRYASTSFLYRLYESPSLPNTLTTSMPLTYSMMVLFMTCAER